MIWDYYEIFENIPSAMSFPDFKYVGNIPRSMMAITLKDRSALWEGASM